MPCSITGAPPCTFTPAGARIGEDALRGDGEGLEARDVLGAAGHMDLAGGDHRGDAAMEAALDPAELVLPRRPFAGDRMHMGVDEAGGPRAVPLASMTVFASAVSRSFARPKAVILPSTAMRVSQPSAIGFLKVAGQEETDIADDQLAAGAPA